MAELTPKQRRRGLEFANTLAKQAAMAPDIISKKAIFRAVKEIREYHGFSVEQKQDLICRMIRLGCATYEDLVRETHFQKPHVIDIIRSMSDAGIVSLTTLQSGDRAGRPITYIRLADPDLVLNTPEK